MPSRLLYLGCQPGLDVMDLQDGLDALAATPGQGSAHPPLAVDGIFGSKTGARVREFQQRNGLTADGIVGPATWAALLTLLQGIPGFQINRTIGGSGPGPAKGTDGSAVYGKPSGGKDGGGGKVAGAGKGSQGSTSTKWDGGGSNASGGVKDYGGGGGAGKAVGTPNMGGYGGPGPRSGKDWNSAFGGSYKGGADAGAFKGGAGGKDAGGKMA